MLVVSSNGLNHGPAKIVFVLPLTRTARQNPFFIPIEPPEGGVRDRSSIICNALRAVSTERFSGRAWGMASNATLTLIEDRLRVLLEL